MEQYNYKWLFKTKDDFFIFTQSTDKIHITSSIKTFSKINFEIEINKLVYNFHKCSLELVNDFIDEVDKIHYFCYIITTEKENIILNKNNIMVDTKNIKEIVTSLEFDDFDLYHYLNYFIKSKIISTFIECNLIGRKVNITIDRKINSIHPKHKDIVYPINYGYISGLIANDGEEQDAYIIEETEELDVYFGVIVAVIHRYNDVEDKLIVAKKYRKYDANELKQMVWFQEQFYDSEVLLEN